MHDPERLCIQSLYRKGLMVYATRRCQATQHDIVLAGSRGRIPGFLRFWPVSEGILIYFCKSKTPFDSILPWLSHLSEWKHSLWKCFQNPFGRRIVVFSSTLVLIYCFVTHSSFENKSTLTVQNSKFGTLPLPRAKHIANVCTKFQNEISQRLWETSNFLENPFCPIGRYISFTSEEILGNRKQG